MQGNLIIAGQHVYGTNGSIKAINPATGEEIEPEFGFASEHNVVQATAEAAHAFQSFKQTTCEKRAAFLETIAENIDTMADEIVARAIEETGLQESRLRGELGRTTGQLRMFAAYIQTGLHKGVRIDPAQPDRKPAPRVDLRQTNVPLGPVVVFGASNFPLAFSVAGGDTASALAAGCPVIVKAHNSHPGLSQLVANCISDAVAVHTLHPGTFSLIYGKGSEIGHQLVSRPEVKAVGFTGSRQAGTSLMRTANERVVPIPVYAEMSAINPVVIFPRILEDSLHEIARGFVDSLTGSSGQLCTAPGVLFIPEGQAGDELVDEIEKSIRVRSGQTMLSPSICASWENGVKRLRSQENVIALSQGVDGVTHNSPGPQVFMTDVRTFQENPLCHEEVFGAVSLLVRYRKESELMNVFAEMDGQLTATIWCAEKDYSMVAEVLPGLQELAGRILMNGWPTGVEVGHAVVHGGPYPATTNSRTTSVGSTAIDRFLRPVAFQDFPNELLPESLKSDNPKHIMGRLIDGVFEK